MRPRFPAGFFLFMEIDMPKEREVDHIEKLSTIWAELAGGNWVLSSKSKETLARFLQYLEPSDIYEALIIASEKLPENSEDELNQRFKYFCGICWTLIKGQKPSIIKVQK